MKAPNLHLNLLRASERQSSSPVRLRVMLPILAVLACLGCCVVGRPRRSVDARQGAVRLH